MTYGTCRTPSPMASHGGSAHGASARPSQILGRKEILELGQRIVEDGSHLPQRGRTNTAAPHAVLEEAHDTAYAAHDVGDVVAVVFPARIAAALVELRDVLCMEGEVR